MAVTSRGRTLELPRHWRDRETSPERTKVWTEPKPPPKVSAAANAAEKKVPVVYYLSRNGHLEHPHFMEVTLSSADGLYLRDVIIRLNYLRGKGMASMYAWSSKRSYKNGFVWHDLTDDDFIHPVHGHEYVLKGSELLRGALSSRDASCTTSAASSSSSDKSLDAPKSYQDDTDSSAPPTCKKKSPSPWQSFDLNEYRVYKAESSSADAALKAADASTQTDDRRHCRRALVRDDVTKPEEEINNPTTELGRDEIDEISPPPSSSSPETLETLIKADVLAGTGGGGPDLQQAPGAHPSARVRASAVLMHLISCGSLSVKDHGGFSLVSQYRARLPRGDGRPEPSDHRPREPDVAVDRASFPAVRLEDKEYFSGSFIETKKKAAAEGAGELASLKRSSSFNADRYSKLDLAEKEADGVRAKCIPRRPSKAAASVARRDGGNKGSSSTRSGDGGAKQPSEQRGA